MAAAWLSKLVGYLKMLYRLEIRVKMTNQPSETLKMIKIFFIFCITYLLNRYMKDVWTGQELRLKLGSQVKIYMCKVTVLETNKIQAESRLNTHNQSLLNKISKC